MHWSSTIHTTRTQTTYGEVFEAYVEQVLAPTLCREQVVTYPKKCKRLQASLPCCAHRGRRRVVRIGESLTPGTGFLSMPSLGNTPHL
jgi:hypothetical protein